MDRPEISLLRFRNGQNALSTFQHGNGNVYSFAFPVDKDNFNFIRHIIFVPTFYNMVINSEAPQKYIYPIESEEPVIVDEKQVSEELKLVNYQTNDEFKISTHQSGAGNRYIIVDDLIGKAGHYVIYSDKKPIQSLSYNYSRMESIPDFMEPEQLRDQLAINNMSQFQLIDANNTNFSEVLKDLNNGKQLWKFFIILAIFSLFIEIAVIQFWK
jgi:hypothetical protein